MFVSSYMILEDFIITFEGTSSPAHERHDNSANLSHSAVLQTCRMASSCQVQLTIVIVEKRKIA